MPPPPLAEIPKVEIDPSGVVKYILLKVQDSNAGAGEDKETEITILRGTSRFQYHSDIYEVTQMSLDPLNCEPLGGGHISLDPDNKRLHIYGHSQGFGKADPEITAKLVREKFPDYTVTIDSENN